MVMRRDGSSLRAIARRLDRDPCHDQPGDPAPAGTPATFRTRRRGRAAQAFARSRKSRNPRKLKPGGALFETVAGRLRQGWSPLQIAGRLRRMASR